MERLEDAEAQDRQAMQAAERERRVAVLRLEVMGRGDAMWRAAQHAAAVATLSGRGVSAAHVGSRSTSLGTGQPAASAPPAMAHADWQTQVDAAAVASLAVNARLHAAVEAQEHAARRAARKLERAVRRSLGCIAAQLARVARVAAAAAVALCADEQSHRQALTAIEERLRDDFAGPAASLASTAHADSERFQCADAARSALRTSEEIQRGSLEDAERAQFFQLRQGAVRGLYGVLLSPSPRGASFTSLATPAAAPPPSALRQSTSPAGTPARPLFGASSPASGEKTKLEALLEARTPPPIE